MWYSKSNLSLQSCDGTVAKLRTVFQEVGRADGVKVVDRCMEDVSARQQQNLGAPGMRRGAHTAPGVLCVCVCACVRVCVRACVCVHACVCV